MTPPRNDNKMDVDLKRRVYQAYDSHDVEALRQVVRANPIIINLAEFVAGGTLLHNAVAGRPLSTIKMLVDEGFDVNAKGSLHEDTPLVRAASTGDIEKVRYLLDHGAILQTEKSVQNPLFGAISAYTSMGNRELPKERFNSIVKALLDAGIDATVRYNTDTMLDMDAMSFACMWGRQDIARMIAEHIYGNDDDTAIKAALADAEIRAKRSSDREAAKVAAQGYA